MRQHNVWCVCVCVVLCVERYVGLQAVQHASPHKTPRTHTKRYAAVSPQLTFTILTFKFCDFNKEPTSSLKMIWKDRNMLERF
jgi:hypothetical protein